MSLMFFVFITRLVGITLAALMGLFFLKSHPKSYNARLFMALCVGTIALFILYGSGTYIDTAYRFDISKSAVYLLFVPVLIFPWAIMALCRSLFQEKQGFPAWVFILLIAQVLLDELEIGCATMSLCIVPDGFLSQGVHIFGFAILPAVIKLAFAIAALYWTIKDWRGDLVESRRRFRWIFLFSQAGLLCFFVVLYFYTIYFNYTLMPTIQNWTTILGSFYIVYFAYVALRFDSKLIVDMVLAPTEQQNPSLPKSPVKNPHASLGKTASLESTKQQALHESNDALMQKLLNLLENEKVYRETGISISSLAQRMELPEYRLRRLIRDGLGFRNFNTLLHQYRLEDACIQLRDPKKSHLPILTIALDVGYGSISSFNGAFKELKQITPTEFRSTSE